MNMVVTVRLYWDHEPNMIVMASHPKFNIAKAIRNSLIAYVRNDQNFVVKLPDETPYEAKMQDITLQLSLNGKQYADVIEWLNGIELGYHNSAIKQVFSHYLDDAYLDELAGKKTKAYEINVGLYWRHDLDLIALNKHPDFDLAGQMKMALKAYADHDEDFVIKIPPPPKERIELNDCSVTFELTEGPDDKAIRCFNEFLGFRNSALIQIFRHYLEKPYLEPVFNQKKYAVLQEVAGRDTDDTEKELPAIDEKQAFGAEGLSPAPKETRSGKPSLGSVTGNEHPSESHDQEQPVVSDQPGGKEDVEKVDVDAEGFDEENAEGLSASFFGTIQNLDQNT